MAFIGTLVGLCSRHARVVVTIFVLAALAAAAFTATHFKMDTDSEKLISAKLDWRQRECALRQAVPAAGQPHPRRHRRADAGAGPCARRRSSATSLAGEKALFPVVRQSGGGEFFRRNGLLFLSTAEVKTTTEQLIAAQPFLGSLAADPSLRGVMDALATALLGVEHGQAKLEQIDRPMTAFGDTLRGVVEGRKTYLSWQSLVTGGAAHTRSFIEVQPALDFDALSPGAAASDAIRAAARGLKLTAEHGVRVRLTGPVPLSDEEFATLAERADLMGAAMLIAVTLTLLLAVRSFRIIACILATLFTGLALTMGLGLWAVGVFNIISIAFRRAVRRAGRRFRHPVLGALPRGAPRRRRSRRRAEAGRARRRHPARARGGGDGGGILLVPADGLRRRRRARADRGHRHGRGPSCCRSPCCRRC